MGCCTRRYNGRVVAATTTAHSGWPSDATTVIKFGTFKGGLNFFIEDKFVAGEAVTYTITKKDDGTTLDTPLEISGNKLEECATGQTMFLPAAGQRTYSGGLTRVGSSLRYHENQPRYLTTTGWPQSRRMECDAMNGFFWGYGQDYNQQGSACSVRCIKTPDTF